MAIRRIEKYAVTHQIGGKTEIRLRFFAGDTPPAVVLKGLPADEARLILDILRNEDGVSHDDVKKSVMMSSDAVVGHGAS